MNEEITYQVVQAAIDCGAREFILCAGSRNSSFVEALRMEERLSVYYWPEERSAAFFALGRSRLLKQPVAIIVTSGTAAGELLPAAMEAFYTGVPLLLITADRPGRFRGSGAPQSAEQVGLFGHYAKYAQDVTPEIPCDLTKWNQHGPAHLNVCLEEPQSQPKFIGRYLSIHPISPKEPNVDLEHAGSTVNRFLSQVERPLAVVSTLKPQAQQAVANTLMTLGIPMIIEGVSGLREDPRLQSLRIRRTDKVLEIAQENGYSIDGILRIGGIPTPRIWRDLEYLKNELHVCSISEQPFSGLSWNKNVISGPIEYLLNHCPLKKNFDSQTSKKWLQSEMSYGQQLRELFDEEPDAEPSLLHALSEMIPTGSHIYLGNSLPIREWNMAASGENRGFTVTASRGLAGIDGQISTFLGLCQPKKENWAILGDLTTLYDMAGCWGLSQLGATHVTIVVINNGGGKIFATMYPHKEMLNLHTLSFEPLAKMWSLSYEKWDAIPSQIDIPGNRLIEIVPDEEATKRFWTKYAQINLAQGKVLAGCK